LVSAVERILLVDDEPRLLLALREVLEGEGHEVSTADGGEAATQIFLAAQAGKTPFTVVITDLGMPYVNGYQVAEVVKASAPATIVIMLTGWGQRLGAAGECPPNVDCVLSKPTNLGELREALELHRDNAQLTPPRERRIGLQ
jgi:DNA-binding response OmpR family regulator